MTDPITVPPVEKPPPGGEQVCPICGAVMSPNGHHHTGGEPVGGAAVAPESTN